MKSNKGFTLVELTAVISILAIIIIIGLPGIISVFSGLKQKVKGFDEEAIEEAAIMYATELNTNNVKYTLPSDMTINGKEYKAGEKLSNYDTKVLLIENGIDVPIEFLVKNNYFEDKKCNYNDEKPKCKVKKECVIHLSFVGEKVENTSYYVVKDYKAELSNSCK